MVHCCGSGMRHQLVGRAETHSLEQSPHQSRYCQNKILALASQHCSADQLYPTQHSNVICTNFAHPLSIVMLALASNISWTPSMLLLSATALAFSGLTLPTAKLMVTSFSFPITLLLGSSCTLSCRLPGPWKGLPMEQLWRVWSINWFSSTKGSDTHRRVTYSNIVINNYHVNDQY